MTLAYNAGGAVPLHHRRYGAKDPKRRLVGWAVVAVVHAIVLWALISGTAHDSVKSARKAMQAVVIQEVIIPPPPPPPPPAPPPPRQVKAPPPRLPTLQAPPPPFVAPAEVAPPPAAPAMPSVATPPPAPPVVAPPAAAPAAPAGTMGPKDIGVVCPTQVAPKMPLQAINRGIEGQVKAEATVRAGKIIDVRILSGPRVFHNAVREAMMQYVCVSGPDDVIVTKDFFFKFQ